MALIKKIILIGFLFVFSGALPKIALSVFYPHDINSTTVGRGFEEILTDLLSVVISIFIIKLCIFFLETTYSEQKELFSLYAPRQLNQLIPLLIGITFGVIRAVNYYN